MKKSEIPKHKIKNGLAAILCFLAGVLALNAFDMILSNILGIVLMVIGVYGIVCVGKDKKFLF